MHDYRYQEYKKPSTELSYFRGDPTENILKIIIEYSLSRMIIQSGGEPTSIFLEHLFDDLFRLRDNFKALGMVLKNGVVYLPDLGDMK